MSYYYDENGVLKKRKKNSENHSSAGKVSFYYDSEGTLKRREPTPDATIPNNDIAPVETKTTVEMPSRPNSMLGKQMSNSYDAIEQIASREVAASKGTVRSSEFDGLTNKGYKEYLDNLQSNATDEKQNKWLQEQRENLIAMQDKSVRNYLSVMLPFYQNAENKAAHKSYSEAKAKMKKLGYTDKQINSLLDTYDRETNAKHNESMMEKVDKLTDKGSGGKVAAQVLGIGAGIESAFAGLESIGATANEKLFGNYKPLDTNKGAFTAGDFKERVSGNIQKDIEGEEPTLARKGLGILYQGATGAADSFTTAMAFGPAAPIVMAAQAVGSSNKDAFERTGSNAKATATGLASGVIEYGTEKMGLDNLWDIMKGSGKAATRSALVNILAQSGIEGMEEATSEALGTIADWIINKADSNLKQNVQRYKEDGKSDKEAWTAAALDALKEVGQAGLIGAISGGISGSAASALGMDTFSKNENKVIDKEVENRISEREKDGTKLKAKEKAEIRKEVEQALKDGDISIDTIESALGGQTFEEFKSYNDQKKALEDEIENFRKMPMSEFTVADSERLRDARKELVDLKQNTNEKQLRERLSKEVSDMTLSDSYIRESYNEKGRRSQAFEADLSKYDKRQQATIQKAIDSGILNNTNKTHKFVDLLAKISADKGVSFDFTDNARIKESGFAVQGATVNGYVKDGNVTLNINSAKALNSVVGHEITHVLEGTEHYAALQEAVFEYAKTKKDYDGRLKTLTELYKNVENADVNKELTADLIGDYLFTDEKFVQQLSTQNRNVFQRIYDEIKYLVKTVTSGSKEAKQLEKVKKIFDEAYKEHMDISKTSQTKYSLMEFSEDGKRFVEIDQDQERFEGHDRSDYPRIAKDIINEKFNGKVIGIDNRMFVNGQGRDEYANPSKFIQGEAYEAKMRAAGELDNLLDAGTNFRNEADGRDGHYHKDVIGGFDYFDTLFKIGDNYYQATINIKNVKKGKLFKDVTQIKDVTQDIMNSYGQSPKSQFLRTSSTNSISQNQQKTTENQKFSISGVNARTANSSLLLKAEHMLDAGADSETVRQETGWYQGYDGKMRFEIDDSESYLIEEPILQQHEDDGDTYFTGKLSDILKHDKLYNAYPELQDIKVIIQETEPGIQGASFKDSIVLSRDLFQRYTKDYREYLDGGRKAEIERIEQSQEYKEYDKYYEDSELQESDPVRWIEEEKKARDKFFASELGKRYHQLKWGKYNGQKYELGWSRQAKEVLMHEIQHSIQDIEKFTKGSSEGYWQRRINEGHNIKTIEQRKRLKELEEEYDRIAEDEKEFFQDMMQLEDMVPDVPRGKFDFDTFEQVEEDPIEWQEFDRKRDELVEKYGDDKFMDFQDLQYELKSLRKKSMSANDAYWRTAGEIEARDTANRLGLTEEQRKEKRPNIDSKNVVLREYSLGSGDIAPIGNWNVKGSDLALEGVPIRQDIAPAQQQDAAVDNMAPWTGEDDLSEGMFSPPEESTEQETDQQEAVISKKNAERIKNIKANIKGLQMSRDITEKEFNTSIAAKTSEYEKLQRKDTKRAAQLLTQIENLKYRKENALAEVDKKIKQQKKAINNIKNSEIAGRRKTKQQQYRSLMNRLIGDTSTWKDKKLGVSYQTNTLRRNLRDIVRDADGKRDIAKADAIYEELQGKYNQHEAELHREANRIKQVFKDMKINKAENAYIQMLGEYRHNPDSTITPDVMKEFYEENKDKIDNAKVDKAIDEARKAYDSLFYRVNDVLKEHGFRELGYKAGYFPHFTEDKQHWLAKLLNWKTQNNEIPTDIAGLTEQFNPERSWQSFDKHRTGDKTDYNFMKGLDTYVQGSLDWIYHIEDIQKRRALENEIRYQHSDEGVKEKLEEIYNNNEYDTDQVQEQIDLVLKTARNPLNNFVTDLRNSTNNLAGKKDTADRSLEYKTNRKIYSTMTNLSNRVSANMVGGSISSALTNFIPITQSWGEVKPVSSLKAMRETIKSYVMDDGMVNKSDFMTNRLRTTENLYQTNWDKISDGVSILMEGIDNFTTQVVWRSKYMENVENGMSEDAAIKNADQFAENVMAGRSRGNMPTIFNSKNPITKVFTAFQLEVSNQYGYMFKDLPQDVGNKSMAKLVQGYGTMFIGAYVYNALYSTLTGRDAAFDPIGIIEQLLRDLGAFGEDEEKEPLEALYNLGGNIAEEMPFIGGLLGGGRIPISSALPYDSPKEAITGTLEDISNKNWKNLTWEWLNPVFYLGMPVGGGQTRKTIQGLSMFDDDLPISGSYTNSGQLRFPVEDTPLNRTQAAVFGQYASKNAKDYFENNRSPLKDKQLEEFLESKLPIKEYWDYREGLKGKTKLEEKADYIAGLDIPISAKNILVNNHTDRDTPIDLSDYDKFGSFAELDYAVKHPGRYAISKTFGDYKVFDKYRSEIEKIEGNKEGSQKSNRDSKKQKILNYIKGLEISEGEKMILFRQKYTSDNRYNSEIIDYLSERNDISYKDKVAILKELGFTVDEDGTVRW